MAMLVYQFETVGFYPTLFRFLAWQVVLLLALADRSHLENKEHVERMQREIDKALMTTGIKRHEFDEVKRDLARMRDYIARVDRVDLKVVRDQDVMAKVSKTLDTIVP